MLARHVYICIFISLSTGPLLSEYASEILAQAGFNHQGGPDSDGTSVNQPDFLQNSKNSLISPSPSPPKEQESNPDLNPNVKNNPSLDHTSVSPQAAKPYVFKVISKVVNVLGVDTTLWLRNTSNQCWASAVMLLIWALNVTHLTQVLI